MLVCGTRGSELARKQTDIVIDALSRLYPDEEFSIKVIKTSGDLFTQKPLFEMGGMGAFVREIDNALLREEIDLAVHSLKDVPTRGRQKVHLAAVLKRGDPADFLVSSTPLEELPANARLGTSSLRRKAQLLRLKSDLRIEPIRGNVTTRIKKVERGDYDATVLSSAGLNRLGLKPPGHPLPLNDFISAPAQGAIGVITRIDSNAAKMLKKLDHADTRMATDIERKIMFELGAGCTAPIGIHAVVSDTTVELKSIILSLDGQKSVMNDYIMKKDTAIEEAGRIAREIMDSGGELIAEAARESKKG